MEPIRILVIDDEPVICNGCQQSLADRGHSVDARMTGREALEALRIPRKGEIDMNHAEGGVGVDAAKGHKILIMEDEKSVAEGLQMILEEEGYEVDLAFTGRSAMDTLRKKGVDLLVADLRLPDMDGMEVVREVKAEAAVYQSHCDHRLPLRILGRGRHEARRIRLPAKTLSG